MTKKVQFSVSITNLFQVFIYQANISTKGDNTNNKACISITSLNWKLRYHNQFQSFKNPTLKNQTAVSLAFEKTGAYTYYKSENYKKIYLGTQW